MTFSLVLSQGLSVLNCVRVQPSGDTETDMAIWIGTNDFMRQHQIDNEFHDIMSLAAEDARRGTDTTGMLAQIPVREVVNLVHNHITAVPSRIVWKG